MESPIRQRVNLLTVTRARDENNVFNKYVRITAIAYRFVKAADEFIWVESCTREAACEFNTFNLVPYAPILDK